jgi:uncharacterized protein YegP (UPF0339 family)
MVKSTYYEIVKLANSETVLERNLGEEDMSTTEVTYNVERPTRLSWSTEKPKTQKRGRQGYLVRYYKDTLADDSQWSVELVTQNGVVVFSSDLLYSSRANARRSVNRLFNGVVAGEVTVEV